MQPMKQAGSSTCSVEGIYFPSWKTCEPRHREKGGTKPGLAAVRGSPCPAVAAAAASGNSERRLCSDGTAHGEAGLGSRAGKKIGSGEFTQRGPGSCYSRHTGGEMQWCLASREVSPERNSPLVKGWKGRALHKGDFKGPSQISWETGAGDRMLQCLSCPKMFIIGQFWGRTVDPDKTLDCSGITILTTFDRENLAKLKHAQKLQQLCLGNDLYSSDCSCLITYVM